MTTATLLPNSPAGNSASTFSIFHMDDLVGDDTRSSIADYLQNPENPTIADFLEDIESKSVLDIGSGLGTIIVDELIKMGLNPDNLHSLDPDESNFAGADSPYERKHTHVMDAGGMNFDSVFDLVVTSYVLPDNKGLWYGKTYSKFMKKISKALKPGGFYLAFEPFDTMPDEMGTNGNTSRTPKTRIQDTGWLRSVGFNSAERIYLPDAPPERNYFTLFTK